MGIRENIHNQVIFGVFTNKTTYIPRLLDSIKKFYPDIPVLVVMREGNIRDNMQVLLDQFARTDRRFWIMLDDDVVFLHGDYVETVVSDMLANRWTIGAINMTNNRDALREPYGLKRCMVAHESTWVAGYFMCIDSLKFTGIRVPTWTPNPQHGIDISLCLEVRHDGGKIGISPGYLYHERKMYEEDIRDVIQFRIAAVRKYGEFGKEAVEDGIMCYTDEFWAASTRIIGDKDTDKLAKFNFVLGRLCGYKNVKVVAQSDESWEFLDALKELGGNKVTEWSPMDAVNSADALLVVGPGLSFDEAKELVKDKGVMLWHDDYADEGVRKNGYNNSFGFWLCINKR